MEISMSKTREQFPLSPKKILKKTMGSIITLAVLFVVWVGVLLVTSSNDKSVSGAMGLATIGILLLMVIIVLITYFYQKWYFAVYFYDLTDDFIIIKKGPITPSEITIPYERVQDVYVDQDLLDRFFGLYDVHLSSATISSGMEAHIDGVKKQAADGLRGFLLQTVQQKISRNRQNINNQNKL
jgi:membrane protein YdbS with pleckstrin-like domain